MPAGRPLMFKTEKELQEAIDSYFVGNDTPTVSGLALHLGFLDRQSIYDYKGREEFSCTIKKAILKIESQHESNLYSRNCTGSIFWLKNHEWKDKHEHEFKKSLFDALTEERNEPDSK